MTANTNIGLFFFGPAGCGKSAMADEMVDRFGAIKVSFAEALRQEVSFMYDIPMTHLRAKPLPDDMRRLLQLHGTEIRRNIFGDDYWIKILKKKILDVIFSMGTLIVCDDTRYMNEYAMLVNLGFVPIRCQPSLEVADNTALKSTEAQQHSSEVDWRSFDATLSLEWDTVKTRVATIEHYLDEFTEFDVGLHRLDKRG